MRFLRFCENRFQEIQVSLSKDVTNVRLDAEGNALQYSVWLFRFLLGVTYIPIVFLKYLAVNVGLKKVPAPQLEMIKAQHESNLNKKRRKVGFQEKKIRPPSAEGQPEEAGNA